MSMEKGDVILPFSKILRKERMALNLTQQALAEELGAEMKAVSRWERGKGLPGLKYRNRLCVFFKKTPEQMGLRPMQNVTDQQTYTLSNSIADDVRDAKSQHIQTEGTESRECEGVQKNSNASSLFSEWVEIPQQAKMYGRTKELAQLQTWIEDEHSQIITISGIGGVGKTALTARLAEQLKGKFDYVLWRSLQNEPSLEYILTRCIQYLSGQEQIEPLNNIDNQILQLIQYFRNYRCLLILDNFESVLQAGQRTGRYRKGYEGYRQLIRSIGEMGHRSCLIVTSREKPEEVAYLEGKTAPIHTMYLNGLEEIDGCKILEDKGLGGTQQELAALVRLYGGNPLALKLVSETVREVCGGDIAYFLQQKEAIFVDLNGLLEEQYQRISIHEREILYWLAIEREMVTLDILRENLTWPLAQQTLLENLKFLLRRSMVESRGPAHFTLQPVIMEYVTARLIELFIHSFNTEDAEVWRNYAMIKSQAKDYVRESQTRLLLALVAEQLLTLLGKEGVERQAVKHLATERQRHDKERSYLAGNVLNLLVYIQSDLRGYDFSHLTIRQAYLQNIFLPEVNFACAYFSSSVFTSTLGNVLSVAFSPDDTLLAVGTVKGEATVYNVSHGYQTRSYQGHTDSVWSVAFNRDGAMLATGSDDLTVRLWNSRTGYCLNILDKHRGRVRCVAFHPAGTLLASGSEDGTVHLWDITTGANIKILVGHTDRIWSLAFSARGDLLATGSTDHTIRLWDVQTGLCLRELHGHTGWVIALAFDPQGRYLISGGDDCFVHVWDAKTWEHIRQLQGHGKRIRSLAFSQDGIKFVSGSEDRSLRLWNVATWQTTYILRGHTHGIRSVAFSRNSKLLASGGDDQTARLWEVSTGYCLRTIQGYTNRVWSAVLSPDGRMLANCGEDQNIRIWDLMTDQRRTLYEPSHGVYCIAYSPDGQTLVSGGEDMSIRIWEVSSGRCLKVLNEHTGWIRAIAVSPDGNTIASGSEDHTIRLWRASTGHCIKLLHGHHNWVRSISFSLDGKLLASGSDDHMIMIWDLAAGDCQMVLKGHSGHVRSLVFSPDGQTLISGGEDQQVFVWNIVKGTVSKQFNAQMGWVRSVAMHPGGQLLAVGGDDTVVYIWDVQRGLPVQVLHGHNHRVRWVSFSTDGRHLISSSDDGSVKFWNVESTLCEKTFACERPYERMDITNAQGLTDAQRNSLRVLGAIE